MKRLLFLFPIILLYGCGPQEEKSCTVPSSTSDAGYVLAGDCQAITWRSEELPIRISIDDSIERQDFVDAILIAGATWEAAAGRPLFNFVINDDAASNGMYFVSANQWEEGKDLSAATRYTADTGNHQMIQARVSFNLTYKFSTMGARDAIDMQSVALHELGHVLGLSHMDSAEDPESVMKSQLAPGVLRQTLTARDVQRLNNHY